MTGRASSMVDQVRAAVDLLGPLAQVDAPLGELTTYRVGGRAAILVEAQTLDDLRRVADALAVSSLPVVVVGRGSNLLVADAGFDGVAVTLAGEAFTSILFGSGSGSGSRARARAEAGGVEAAGVEAGAVEAAGVEAAGVEAIVPVLAGGAVQLPVLARRTAAAGLTGLEWAVGVPGSVGGAVRMNAGGHGADMRATLRSCRWMDLRTGELAERAVAELELGYRTSAVAAHHVVVSAEFGLTAGDTAASEATIREIVRWRREHQPGGQNAGSVFTNPPGESPHNSAGWLVEAAGLRGYRRGSAMVSDKHGNFIQADPGGSADDVLALMLEVQGQVAARLGVPLRAEVRLIGFDDASVTALRSGPLEAR